MIVLGGFKEQLLKKYDLQKAFNSRAHVCLANIKRLKANCL